MYRSLWYTWAGSFSVVDDRYNAIDFIGNSRKRGEKTRRQVYLTIKPKRRVRSNYLRPLRLLVIFFALKCIRESTYRISNTTPFLK